MILITTIQTLDSPPETMKPPNPYEFPLFIADTLDFLHHFSLFFVLPILTVVFSAILSAALAKWAYRSLFGRYATPDELLDEAVELLKKDGCTVSVVSAMDNDGVVGIGGKRSKTKIFGASSKKPRRKVNTNNGGAVDKFARLLFSSESPSSLNRKRALDDLRLVIRLDPGKIKAYEVLATELFYGEINGVSSDEGGYEQSNFYLQKTRTTKQKQQSKSKILPIDNPNEGGYDDTGLRHRKTMNTSSASGQIEKLTALAKPNDEINQPLRNLSPTLLECLEVIHQGLHVDPKNDSLQKLKSELQVVVKYGKSSVHTKMMTVGSFGWMG
mmetsp:Transcript_5926/g.12340  ORF Transcript_5926/g.12340 Transcript_5926/m.12340 type:complete len:328 (-) Transcript_5926:193-1176(-)